MIHCFYHSSDLDGQLSGAIVKKYEKGAVLKGIDYGEEFDFDAIGENDRVFMVDFGLQPYEEKMPKLKEKCHELIWIDHHKTAVVWAEEAGFKCSGVQDVTRAGCELTWKYFNEYRSYEQMPKGILLLGMYDSWRNDDKRLWDDQIMPFQYGMRVMAGQPDEATRLKVFDEVLNSEDLFIRSTIANGMGILSYQAMMDRKTMEALSYDIEWEGHKCLVCNSTMSNSQFFQCKWDKSKYDLMVSYKHVKGEFYTISLYTDKEGIDGSKIATKYGGGGHAQASGWQSKELPWAK